MLSHSGRACLSRLLVAPAWRGVLGGWGPGLAAAILNMGGRHLLSRRHQLRDAAGQALRNRFLLQKSSFRKVTAVRPLTKLNFVLVFDTGKTPPPPHALWARPPEDPRKTQQMYVFVVVLHGCGWVWFAWWLGWVCFGLVWVCFGFASGFFGLPLGLHGLGLGLLWVRLALLCVGLSLLWPGSGFGSGWVWSVWGLLELVLASLRVWMGFFQTGFGFSLGLL